MKPGQRVICIDATRPGWTHEFYDQWPQHHALYTIREVRSQGRDTPGQDWDAIPGVLLEELRNGPDPANKRGMELGFPASRFRVVEETKTRAALSMAETQPMRIS
jgi:hypothetical protein